MSLYPDEKGLYIDTLARVDSEQVIHRNELVGWILSKWSGKGVTEEGIRLLIERMGCQHMFSIDSKGFIRPIGLVKEDYVKQYLEETCRIPATEHIELRPEITELDYCARSSMEYFRFSLPCDSGFAPGYGSVAVLPRPYPQFRVVGERTVDSSMPGFFWFLDSHPVDTSPPAHAFIFQKKFSLWWPGPADTSARPIR